MILDLDTCPQCGYINKSHPYICPQCGCNLDAHRKAIIAEREKQAKIEEERKQNEKTDREYQRAINLYNEGQFKEAMVSFLALGNYADSLSYVDKCRNVFYEDAIAHFDANPGLKMLYRQMTEGVFVTSEKELKTHLKTLTVSDYKKIEKRFEELNGYQSSFLYISCCNQAIDYLAEYEKQEEYGKGVRLFEKGDYEGARAVFQRLEAYDDAPEYVKKCNETIAEISAKEKETAERKVKNANAILVIEKILQVIAHVLPFIMLVVFAVLLFSNKQQLTIKHHFGGWLAGWIIYLIAIIAATGTWAAKKSENKWKTQETRSRVTASIFTAITIALSVIVFVNAAKLTPNFSVTKIIDYQVTNIVKSEGYDSTTTTITFTLKNDSNFDVYYTEGEMKFYDGDKEVASFTVRFNGDYTSDTTNVAVLKFEESRNASMSLYNTPTDKLRITYQIKTMNFDEGMYAQDFVDVNVKPFEIAIAR